MQDGSILPGNEDGSLSRDEQESCLGVVFWVGEKPNRLLYSYHWTHTANKRGDHLLMHDHPGCVHGIVVALTNAGKTEWSSTSMGNTYTWLVSYAAPDDGKKLMARNLPPHFGYNTSRCIQWYRDYGGQRTEAYDAIEVLARTNPTPVGCSGWYFPSDYEMYIMTRGTLDLDKDHHAAGTPSSMPIRRKPEAVNLIQMTSIGAVLIINTSHCKHLAIILILWQTNGISTTSVPCWYSGSYTCGSCEIKRFIVSPAKERRLLIEWINKEQT